MVDQSEYDRGVDAGKIEARLANHDEHLQTINGSIGRMAQETAALRTETVREIQALTLEVQRLADQATARAGTVDAQRTSDKATVLTTAAALKDADIARRDKSADTWSPFQRAIAVLAAVASVAAVYLAVRPR
jgi:hypothetical protein